MKGIRHSQISFVLLINTFNRICVAQLVERLLPTPELRSSNLEMDQFYLLSISVKTRPKPAPLSTTTRKTIQIIPGLFWLRQKEAGNLFDCSKKIQILQKWNQNWHSKSLFNWHFPGSFFLFSSFLYNCSLKVDGNWIRTRVLWNMKRPRCQLCHNNCSLQSKFFGNYRL